MPRPRPRIERPPILSSAVKAEAKAARKAPDHLILLRQLPCAATGQLGHIEVHHLCEGFDLGRGMGLKAGDRWAIPLCHRVHMDEAHGKPGQGKPETYLLHAYGVQARDLAEALWNKRGDLGAMERIVFRHWQASQDRLRRAG